MLLFANDNDCALKLNNSTTHDSKSINGASRLHALDALRGVAALAVVFWHWQHFGSLGPFVEPFVRASQPLYGVFRIFYDFGELAVDLFFQLSGFIFLWLYSESIYSRTIAPFRFFLLRFSRLYPLHFVTLLLVSAGQLIYIAANGRGFIYENTNLGHFVLQLFLMSSVGLEDGHSFNGPIWSVSVEVLLYALFFAICRLGLHRPLWLLLFSVIGFELLSRLHLPVGRGVGSFFLGGLTYAMYSKLKLFPLDRRTYVAVIGLTLLLWAATLVHVYFGEIVRHDSWLPISAFVPGKQFALFVLFPLTILSLALYESQSPTNLPALEFLGNISYSSYLLHFPLQLLFALLMHKLGLTGDFFLTGFSLILFFALLILISWASYRYLEMPALRYIRASWPIRGSNPISS